MILTFSVRAEADLQNIYDHYSAFGGAVLSNVAEDIFSTIELIVTYPGSGRTAPKGYRRSVSSRYGFTILYQLQDDTLLVEGVFRFQNR